jgi:hypothetical protein
LLSSQHIPQDDHVAICMQYQRLWQILLSGIQAISSPSMYSFVDRLYNIFRYITLIIC